MPDRTVYSTLATTEAFIPAQKDVLVTVRFSAESRCSQSGSVATNWCGVRILVDGAEAQPVETISGQDFAFDSTDGGAEGVGSWEAHSMDRHHCVRNTDATLRVVPIEVQWAVTNLNNDPVPPSFWIDDWTVTVEESLGCVRFPTTTGG